MITGDLDAELVRALRALAEDGELPPGQAAPLVTTATWRPAPGDDPTAYATSLPFELARRAGGDAAGLAAALAARIAAVPWVATAEPTGAGYLTITVTAAALASVARRIVAAGPGCARSDLLRGTIVTIGPWPDPAAASNWRQAWQQQEAAMAARLAACAGASAACAFGRERGEPRANLRAPADSPVAGAVAYFGADAVRYRLARTLPERADELGRPSSWTDHLATVQRGHGEAAATLRWAGELGLGRAGAGEDWLASDVERDLLGLLSWLPARVGSAARRRRPAEVPRYLEQVAVAWTACRLESPALPFGGTAAPRDPHVTAARLMLADAVRAVLAAGLALAGITATDRI
jgi:arginyl-tRNA synthetase